MFKRFAGDERGSIGAVLALGSLTLLGAISASLDYSRMTNARGDLSVAADAAALAAAQAPASKQQAIARQVFDANFRDSAEVTSFTVNTFRRGNDEVLRVEATASVQMTLAQTIGYTAAPVRALSEVVLGNDADIQIALVLDVTGSMLGSKLTSLKSAASSMVNTLYDKLTKANQVKMSVVPFAEYVNVGLSNRNKPWISVPPDSSSTQQACWQTRDVIRTYNCRTEYRTWNSCNDGVCTQQGGNVNVCDRDYGPYYQTCQNQTTTVKWNGCVGSRNYPLNVRDENYIANPVPGIMNVSCPPALTPLSSSRPTVLGAISGLAASGNTYIPGGLMWGWAALSQIDPFTEPTNAGRTTKRYLVLMTDGENTKSPTYPKHDGSNTATSNTLTAELCTNIKTADIEVFTIAFEVTSNSVKTMLRTCASSVDNYFDATNSTQLAAAFGAIAQQMTQLRIAR